MKIVIGITGCSGAIYGIKLLENLKNHEKYLIISENGKKIIELETTYKIEDVKKLVNYYYENNDLFAPIASGSFKFDSLVIVPCSGATFSKITHGISDNLITRVASVCLKERRTLIVVPRETPLSTIQLQNLTRLSEKGVVILPAMPAFYHEPKKIEDLVDFVIGRILDILKVEHTLYRRWH
jgi:4-hydroxy-3-polyprenylbenzoate decarboxylase